MYFYSFFFGSFWNIVLVLMLISLFRKVGRLNARISKLENGAPVVKASTAPAQTFSNFAGDTAPAGVPQSPMQEYVSSAKTSVSEPESEESDIANWFKDNLLLKVGVLLILLGFGWFVSYAFAHDWIGPVGRITLGVVLGTLVTLFGTFRLGKNQLQGRALTVLGTALVIISILAGEYYYQFFTSGVVLALVFIISLYVTVTSAGHDDEKLAVYGVVVSLFAPYFSHSFGMDRITLFFYLFFASVAAIWVTVYKKWKSVTLVGLTGVFMYSLGYVFAGSVGSYEYKYFLLWLGYGLSLVYMATNIWNMVQNALELDMEDLYISVINTIMILGFTTIIIPEIYQSLVLVVWMLVFALTGFFVFMKTRNEKLFYIHSGIAVLFLGIATAIELSGPTLVIAFAIESAILTVATYIITNNIKITEYMSLTIALPVMLSMQSVYSSAWRTSIFHSDFVVLVLMTVLLAVLGEFFRLNDRGQSEGAKIHNVALATSSAYAFALVWLCSHTLIQDNDTAVFFSLFVYTIVGLGTHFYGLFNSHNTLRKYGMTVLVLVVLRLLLVDVWNMDLVLRVVTFIVLGAMFMSSAFISKKQNKLN